MKTYKTHLLPLFLWILCVCFPCMQSIAQKPNIVFIIVDDLNDYAGVLGGHPQAETPAMDTIVSWGSSFLNAHASAPKCAPSRISFLTGKDVAYTQIYINNTCSPFRSYFTEAKGNAFIYTLPEYLKDDGGYYTYGINKIYHCFDSYPDYDDSTADPCSKGLSWNKYSWFYDGDNAIVLTYGNNHNYGVHLMQWSLIPDSMEDISYDHLAIDSAIDFIRGFDDGSINTCGRPFCVMIGLRKPHLPWYVPEKDYLDYYQGDYTEEPYQYPYNRPYNADPANGVIMPPQPDTLFGDFYAFGENSLSQYFAGYDSQYFYIQDKMSDYISDFLTGAGLSDSEREAALNASIRANAAMAYLASIKHVDTQISRLLDTLKQHPALLSNTIIVLISDHGFSLGEKRHWQKGTMWETDLRVPFVIADMRDVHAQTVNTSVSLLDLFPTLCDLTGTPLPEFPDGTPYLDGHSLVPLMEDPELPWEKPSLAAYKEHGHTECSCYPQLSVRNDRFHYIQYESNDSVYLSSNCHKPYSYYEAELYDIGLNRETDPHEWHNRINDPEYAPMVHYLQQFLPDSNLYLQKTFKALIYNDPVPCFLANDDTLHLGINLYDPEGDLLPTPPDSLHIFWYTTILSDTVEGMSASFALSEIPPAEFSTLEHLFVYVEIDDSAGHIIGLNTKTFYLNDANTPSSDFTLAHETSNTISIQDYTVSGSYTASWWDFGDGALRYETWPAPHTYFTTGNYIVTNYLQYGNDPDCIVAVSDSVMITAIQPPQKPGLHIYPNPANNFLHIDLPGTTCSALRIFDIGGRLIYTNDNLNGASALDLNVSYFPPGMYMLSLVCGNAFKNAPFIVQHR